MSVSPELFRNILYSLSGLSFGAALMALTVHTWKWREAPRLHTGFILVKLGWLLAVGMVFWTIIIPITAIPPTWQGWTYAVGLALGAIGMVLVSRKY